MLSVPDLNLGSIDAVNYTARKEKEFLARIFLRDSFLESILDERKYFLIGEKGTGKTAYSVLLSNMDYKETNSTIRTITGTDYEKFIQLKQSGHLKISDYRDSWKVILLLLAAHHVLEREGGQLLQFAKFKNLKSAIDEYYNSAFSPEVTNALELVENAEVAASVMSRHAKIGVGAKESRTETGQGFQINLLLIERLIKESIGSLKLSRNHILFVDGIDVRPQEMEFETYIECIRGLAHATWSLNTEFFSKIRDSKGRIIDLLPEFWTALSWKILIYHPWPGGGIFHEEIEVFREPDRIHSAAG